MGVHMDYNVWFMCESCLCTENGLIPLVWRL
jgi:hypothetical protein